MGLGKLMGKDALNKSGITGEGRGDYRTAVSGKRDLGAPFGGRRQANAAS